TRERFALTSTPYSPGFSSRHAPQPALIASQRPLTCGSPCVPSALTSDNAGSAPQPHGPVITCAGQQSPARAERHRPDRAGVAGQGALVLAGGRIPQPHRLVLAPAGQQPPVRAERHAPDPPGVTGKGALVLAGGQIPQPHRPVLAPAGQQPPVRAE